MARGRVGLDITAEGSQATRVLSDLEQRVQRMDEEPIRPKVDETAALRSLERIREALGEPIPLQLDESDVRASAQRIRSLLQEAVEVDPRIDFSRVYSDISALGNRLERELRERISAAIDLDIDVDASGGGGFGFFPQFGRRRRRDRDVDVKGAGFFASPAGAQTFVIEQPYGPEPSALDFPYGPTAPVARAAQATGWLGRATGAVSRWFGFPERQVVSQLEEAAQRFSAASNVNLRYAQGLEAIPGLPPESVAQAQQQFIEAAQAFDAWAIQDISTFDRQLGDLTRESAEDLTQLASNIGFNRVLREQGIEGVIPRTARNLGDYLGFSGRSALTSFELRQATLLREAQRGNLTPEQLIGLIARRDEAAHALAEANARVYGEEGLDLTFRAAHARDPEALAALDRLRSGKGLTGDVNYLRRRILASGGALTSVGAYLGIDYLLSAGGDPQQQAEQILQPEVYPFAQAPQATGRQTEINRDIEQQFGLDALERRVQEAESRAQQALLDSSFQGTVPPGGFGELGQRVPRRPDFTDPAEAREIADFERRRLERQRHQLATNISELGRLTGLSPDQAREYLGFLGRGDNRLVDDAAELYLLYYSQFLREPGRGIPSPVDVLAEIYSGVNREGDAFNFFEGSQYPQIAALTALPRQQGLYAAGLGLHPELQVPWDDLGVGGVAYGRSIQRTGLEQGIAAVRPDILRFATENAQLTLGREIQRALQTNLEGRFRTQTEAALTAVQQGDLTGAADQLLGGITEGVYDASLLEALQVASSFQRLTPEDFNTLRTGLGGYVRPFTPSIDFDTREAALVVEQSSLLYGQQNADQVVYQARRRRLGFTQAEIDANIASNEGRGAGYDFSALLPQAQLDTQNRALDRLEAARDRAEHQDRILQAEWEQRQAALQRYETPLLLPPVGAWRTYVPAAGPGGGGYTIPAPGAPGPRITREGLAPPGLYLDTRQSRAAIWQDLDRAAAARAAGPDLVSDQEYDALTRALLLDIGIEAPYLRAQEPPWERAQVQAAAVLAQGGYQLGRRPRDISYQSVGDLVANSAGVGVATYIGTAAGGPWGAALGAFTGGLTEALLGEAVDLLGDIAGFSRPKVAEADVSIFGTERISSSRAILDGIVQPVALTVNIGKVEANDPAALVDRLEPVLEDRIARGTFIPRDGYYSKGDR